MQTEFRVFAKNLWNGDIRPLFSGSFISLPQSAFTQAFDHTVLYLWSKKITYLMEEWKVPDDTDDSCFGATVYKQ